MKTSRSFLQHGSVSKLNRAIPLSAVGARFARPKTVCFVSSGRRTLPLRTKRQHYPHFEFNCKVCTYASDIIHILTHPPVCKVCTYASDYTYGGIRPHVYTHQVTRIYVSSYTYVRMSLHVYMSLCQAPSYPVPGFD